jgi:hypothetical protein
VQDSLARICDPPCLPNASRPRYKRSFHFQSFPLLLCLSIFSRLSTLNHLHEPSSPCRLDIASFFPSVLLIKAFFSVHDHPIEMFPTSNPRRPALIRYWQRLARRLDIQDPSEAALISSTQELDPQPSRTTSLNDNRFLCRQRATQYPTRTRITVAG